MKQTLSPNVKSIKRAIYGLYSMIINTKPVVASLIITFTLVITLSPHSVMAADDHPERPNATSISVPSTTSGTIDPQGDRDWFKFPTQGGSNYHALVVL